VLSIHFAEKIVQAIICDEEFLLTLKQQFTAGRFCTKVQPTVIYNIHRLDSYTNKRLKLKSSDFVSDLDKCIDFKPNNNTGMLYISKEQAVRLLPRVQCDPLSQKRH